MSVAVQIEVTRSRSVAAWAAICALVAASGLILAAVQLLEGPTLLVEASGLRVSLAVGCVALAVCTVGCAARDLRSSQAGAAGLSLRVDEEGMPVLHGPALSPARPMTLRASCTLPGLTLLVMAPSSAQPSTRRSARPTVLLLGRDAVSADAWRRLHVWLRWIERG
jgi:hypothetical protein